ncbi:hypothetical protein BDN71DRAFT_1462552 [Pleurotus eryngii]|uniref:GYF domain-containing protein n=1 Tax=Pleurotus eryngii TaxID=5323 RepID=A0A9P6A904_PLEER|nr:hypothetical protein BDN71DRAFT_1462552 [Pleurotus eryngii]
MPVGQKRAAGGSAGPSTSQTSHASKKTRFVEPLDDPVNFAEEVDSALENPSARRKGRVKQEGYDSDSSDDGEGVVFSRKKDGQDADEDEDMFAIGEKEEKEQPSAKKKKEEYMKLGDIEGQVFADNSGSDSEESDEPEDEDDAERRKKEGMGYELSSFNMKEEMEEGKFTEDGMYVRSFDPHGVHDRWMEGLDEREIKLARRRKRKQEKLQKERIQAEEQELEQSGGKGALERELVGMLKKGESVLEALQRLGARSRKAKGPTRSSKTASLDKPKSVSDIDHITHLASNIMSLGDTDIYSKTYEELVRDIRRSGAVDQAWVPPSADVQYEYKWDMPEVVGQEAASFGPYSEEEMKAWYKAAYFGPTGDKVKVRSVGGEWGDWDDVIS